MSSAPKTPPPVPYASPHRDRPCARLGYFMSEQYFAEVRALRARLMADDAFVRMFPPLDK